MNCEKWTSRFVAVAMAFGLALAGVGCVVTGFDLDADVFGIALYGLMLSVLAGLVLNIRWGNLIFAGILAVAVHWLWVQEDLIGSAEGLLYWISCRFDQAYHWGVVYWSPEAPEGVALEPALLVCAIPVIWAAAWTILRRKPAILAVPVAMLMPAVCFIITNSVPDIWCLFLLCAGLLLMILTQTVRRRSSSEGNRLMALLLIPSLLCTSLLFWAVPMEGYLPEVETPQWMQNWLTGNGPGVGGTDPGAVADLTALGPKRDTRAEVMQVRTDRRGVIYLRGQAYDQYEGTAWSVSNVDTSKDCYWPTKNMVPDGTVSITNRVSQTLRYVPYYPQNGAWLNQIQYGKLEGDRIKEYSFPVMTRAAGDNLNTAIVRDVLVEQCLQLPDATSMQAKQILKMMGMNLGYSNLKKAQLIGDYVKNLAEYDAQTGSMPEDQEDFAVWFLTEAETGYCVHFATAATVLLRAAGVPARYVTGYMVDVGEGYAVVEQRHAHAWVEYLDETRGWTVLDPTPVSEQPDVTEPTESAPTESTEPTEDTEPTLSTTATESEQTEPTMETQTVESTGSEENEQIQGQPVKKMDWQWLWNVLKYAALAAGIAGIAAGQYFLRIALRSRKRRKGTVNEKALEDWREVVRLSRLLRQPIPEALEELAEKAKFSQHTLTREERHLFRRQLAALGSVLQSKNWFCRFMLKLVFAIK